MFWRYTGCLRKKYGVADYQYENVKHINVIFSDLNKNNLCLVECEVSTPCVKRN